MDEITKKKIKEVLIAAAVGALVTFLTHLLEFLVGIKGSETANILGGGTSSLVYLQKALKNLV